MIEKKRGSVRIIHLSDLHVGEWGASLDDEIKAMIKDIADNFQGANFVVITGDLTFSGEAKQFKVISEKIIPRISAAAHVGKKKFIVVPGNHDVHRESATASIKIAVEGMKTGITNPDNLVTEVLTSQVFDNYQNFVSTTGVMTRARCQDGFCTITLTDARSQLGKISFACINTAWACIEDSRKGDVFVSRKQLEFAREATEEGQLKIVALHHDINWLHDSEVELIERMSSDFDIMLMGHVHRDASVLRQTPNNTALLLTGAAFANDAHAEYLGYNVYDIDPFDCKVTIYYRKYVAARHKFVPNVDCFDDGKAELPYRCPAPLISDDGKPRVYTYLPVVENDQISEQLRKMQGLEHPVYIPPVLEQVALDEGCEKLTIIDLGSFLEKDVLLYARRECGKTIFLEKLAIEENDVVYVDCKDVQRRQKQAPDYFKEALRSKIGNRPVDGLVVAIDHIILEDSNELPVLRETLSEFGMAEHLIVATSSEFLFKSALNNKATSSFRKVRLKAWGVKAIEEFAVKFWHEKFPGNAPRIDYLKTCLEHSDLPITPVIVCVFISLFAIAGSEDGHANITSLIDRIAEVRFGVKKQNYIDLLMMLACEHHRRRVDRIPLDDAKRLIDGYYDSRNLDYERDSILSNLVDSKFVLVEDARWIRFSYFVFRDYFVARAIDRGMLLISDLISTDVSILANASPLILYGAIKRDDSLVIEEVFNYLSKVCSNKIDPCFDFSKLDEFISYLFMSHRQSVEEEQTMVEEERRKRDQYKELQYEFEENRRRHEQYRNAQKHVADIYDDLGHSYVERLVSLLTVAYNLYRNLETISAAKKEEYLKSILEFHVYCNLMMIQSFREITQDREFKSIIAYVVTIGGEIFLRMELFSPVLRKTIVNVLSKEKNDLKRFLLISLYAAGRFDGYEHMIEEFAAATQSFTAIEMLYFKVRQMLVSCRTESIPDKLLKLFRAVVLRRNQIFKLRENDISGEITSVKRSHYTNFHWEDKGIK